MELKDPHQLSKELDHMDLEEPPVIMISGTDSGTVDTVLERIKKRLHKEIGQFESIIFTGENGEEYRLQEELFNVPLFSPYRLVLIRQASEVFKPVLVSVNRQKNWKHQFERLPERTLILIQYDGAASKKISGIFGKRLVHLTTRDLYANQVVDAIRSVSHRIHLNLSDEALHMLAENIEPRQAVIEQKLTTLKELLGTQANKIIQSEELREVLFPGQGCNSFSLVDGIFALNHQVVQRELMRFNADTDNFFAIFKLMLYRVNEIRKAQIGFKLGMQNKELIDFLGLGNRPPFVQKKILSRLSTEVPRFHLNMLDKIYELLIEIQKDFRSRVGPGHHQVVFQQRILETFFVQPGRNKASV